MICWQMLSICNALTRGSYAFLQADLDFSKKQAEQFGEDIDAWKAAVTARDAEIQNLQVNTLALKSAVSVHVCTRKQHL